MFDSCVPQLAPHFGWLMNPNDVKLKDFLIRCIDASYVVLAGSPTGRSSSPSVVPQRKCPGPNAVFLLRSLLGRSTDKSRIWHGVEKNIISFC